LPWNTDGAVSIELIESPIKLLPLRIRHRDGFRRRSETLPELVQELQSLLRAEAGNLYRSHKLSIPERLRPAIMSFNAVE
jgi:hypothetical protein